MEATRTGGGVTEKDHHSPPQTAVDAPQDAPLVTPDEPLILRPAVEMPSISPEGPHLPPWGETIQELPEAKAICHICCDSLQENITVLKTGCGCESSLVHEKCAEQNKACNYCEEDIHYTPVTLSTRTTEENIKDRSGNWFTRLLTRKKA